MEEEGEGAEEEGEVGGGCFAAVEEAEGAEELAGAWGVVGEGEFVDFVVVCRC